MRPLSTMTTATLDPGIWVRMGGVGGHGLEGGREDKDSVEVCKV